MGVPNVESVADALRQYLSLSEEEELNPATRLREDLGMPQETLEGLLAHFSARMRFPYDEKPDDHRMWFDMGLTHERSEEQLACDRMNGIDFGPPGTVQRLYQVVFQGFMNGDNFNEIGSS